MEIERVITIRSNIKAIGWVYIIVFGGIGLYTLAALAIGVLMRSEAGNFFQGTPEITEFGALLESFMFIAFSLLILSLLTILVSVYLMELKRWAANTINVLSALMVLSLLAYVVYLSVAFQVNEHADSYPKYANNIQKVQTIIVGTGGLLLAWLITKANLLLLKKEYRSFFH